MHTKRLDNHLSSVTVQQVRSSPGAESVGGAWLRPATREPGGDRSFVPLEHPEIWLVQGNPAVYFSPPG
jgi:hypothetical protein